MIEPTRFESSNFETVFDVFESAFVEELEEMMVNKLFEQKALEIPGTDHEILEFAGRTNYKIRLKRPNKNVWSVPLKSIRASIKKVLREGQIDSAEKKNRGRGVLNPEHALPVSWLMRTLPEEEFDARSFIGNVVEHPTLGEGKVCRISDNGNVEVKFKRRSVMMKPGFVRLKIS